MDSTQASRGRKSAGAGVILHRGWHARGQPDAGGSNWCVPSTTSTKVVCPRPVTSSNRLWHAVVRSTGFSWKRVPRMPSSATDEHRFSRINALVECGVSPKPRPHSSPGADSSKWCVPITTNHPGEPRTEVRGCECDIGLRLACPEVGPVQTVQSGVSPAPCPPAPLHKVVCPQHQSAVSPPNGRLQSPVARRSS